MKIDGKWMTMCVAVALAAATVIAYSSAGSFALVNCDDYEYLFSPRTIFGVEHAIWMPLTWLSYSLEGWLGFNVGMRHWTNVAIHAVNAVLLFALLRRIFPRGVWLAAFATFVWAVHPLRVESVVWLSSRKDEISTFFFLVSMIAWTGRRSVHWIIALAILSLGAAAKPSVMVFPVFALATDFLVLGRRKPWWAYSVATGVAIYIAGLATWAQSVGGACDALASVPLWYRLWNAMSAITVYLGNELVFEGMAPQCMMRWPYPPRWSIVGAIVLLVMGGYVLKRACRGRGALVVDPVLAGVFVFFLALVPFLGIVGFGAHAFADRFTLLPSIGLSIAAVGLFDDLVRDGSRWVKCAFAVIFLGVCLVLGRETVRQTSYWQGDRVLFTHTLEVDGVRNAQAQIVLGGDAYEFRHDMADVYAHFREIPLDKWPLYAHYGWMYVEAAFATGHVKEAESFFDWLSGWDAAQARARSARGGYPPWAHPDFSSHSYRLADVLRLAYKGDADFRKVANQRLAELIMRNPNDHGVLNVCYRLAILDGRDGEIERKAAQCVIGTDPYMKNRWAFAGVGVERGRSEP